MSEHVRTPPGPRKQLRYQRVNHTLDLIISYGTDPTDIDIIPQSDDVTDHYMVTCILRTAVICHAAPRYRPGRTILPSTINNFSNCLSNLSQLLPEPKQTDELEELTSTMSTILSGTLDIVAPIRLKKVREKI